MTITIEIGEVAMKRSKLSSAGVDVSTPELSQAKASSTGVDWRVISIMTTGGGFSSAR